jgi:Tfp pilus assembly protein PilN
MIRINLLGQPRPKARRRPGPAEGGVQIIFGLVAVGLAVAFLFVHWGLYRNELNSVNLEISKLQDQKNSLLGVKAEIEQLQREKAARQQRVDVIKQLQRNRTGAQELLDAVANTVTRVDALWMTSLTRKGNDLTMEGSADSIAAVANFITQLKRNGYFDKIEISESRQDERRLNVTTFLFKLTASFALPQGKAPATAPGKS